MRAAKLAQRHGHNAVQTRLATCVSVKGVGKGAQKAPWEASVPVALTRTDGSTCIASFKAPAVEGSSLPPLYGLTSMKEHRVVLDFIRNELIMCGPGDCVITPPHCSERFQLYQSLRDT